MKCRLLTDTDADVATFPKTQSHLLKDRERPGRTPVKYLPAGAEYEHPMAPDFCRRGMAEPADEECAAAVGMTVDQMKIRQVKYARLAAGIAPEDYALFDAGVISGYEIVEGRTAYLPGPNYEAWRIEKEAAEQTIDEEDEGL